MAYTIPWEMLGTWVSGDVGGITIYTDRFGRKVAFPKSPPDKPPSEEQIAIRARFKTAQANWKALTDVEKGKLEAAMIKANAVMTGQNFFISISLTNDQTAKETVERQTGISLVPIVFIP